MVPAQKINFPQNMNPYTLTIIFGWHTQMLHISPQIILEIDRISSAAQIEILTFYVT
jgi:hypothetical protein